MSKCVLVDFRMRKIEKEYFENSGYKVIDIRYNNNLYDEIASHVDISCVKVGNDIMVSPDRFAELSEDIECIMGKTELGAEYPKDIPYNVCIMGKTAIHNFKYTDEILKQKLIDEKFELINVNQGYTKCSIVPIDDKSYITSDIAIARVLKENGLDVLFVHEPDIKLLRRTNKLQQDVNSMFFEYSDMQGFIGGAMVTMKDEVIVFGDINKLLNKDKIIKFIEGKGKKVRSFDSLNVIDYGGIVIVEK